MRANAVQYVKDVADFAATMGAPTVIVHPTACMKTQPLAAPEDERRWAVEGIRAAGEYAAPLGVNLSLECWNRYETYFMNRLEQAASLWDEVGLSNGGIQGDTFHMSLEEASIAGCVSRSTVLSCSTSTSPTPTVPRRAPGTLDFRADPASAASTSGTPGTSASSCFRQSPTPSAP